MEVLEQRLYYPLLANQTAWVWVSQLAHVPLLLDILRLGKETGSSRGFSTSNLSYSHLRILTLPTPVEEPARSLTQSTHKHTTVSPAEFFLVFLFFFFFRGLLLDAGCKDKEGKSCQHSCELQGCQLHRKKSISHRDQHTEGPQVKPKFIL